MSIEKKDNSIIINYCDIKSELKGKYLHGFIIEEDKSIIEILFPFFIDFFNFRKNFITIYDKLIQKEKKYYIDPSEGIKIDIDTIKNEYKIYIEEQLIYYEPICAEEISKYMETTENYLGIILRIECISDNHEENKFFEIYIENVVCDGKKVNDCSKFMNRNSILNLPDANWYKDGTTRPGGLALGFMKHDIEGIEYPIIVFDDINESLKVYYKELLARTLIVRDGFIKNLNIIIDELGESQIIVKAETMDLEDKQESFETIVPINTSENYLKFKKAYSEHGFAYFIFKSDCDNENYKIKNKCSNIIILKKESKIRYSNWFLPENIYLGGYESEKKVLINSDTLEVGIYKYFGISKVKLENLKMVPNEVISNLIAKELKLPVVNTEFHMDEKTIGVISKLIIPPVYKYNQIKDKNQIIELPLIDMVAFDIFICNTDRHIDNICFSKSGSRYQPYLIDHMRCLGGYETIDKSELFKSTMTYIFNFTGLSFISNEINNIRQFQEIIMKIQNLNMKELFKHFSYNELQVFSRVFDISIDEYISKVISGLEYRQVNIQKLVKSTLGL